MHSLRSAAVQYTNYGTGGAFELPTQSGTYLVNSRHCTPNRSAHYIQKSSDFFGVILFSYIENQASCDCGIEF